MDRIERYLSDQTAKRIEWIKIIPKILWVLILLIIIILFRHEIRSKINDASSFKNSLFEIEFQRRIDDLNSRKLDRSVGDSLLVPFSKTEQEFLHYRAGKMWNLLQRKRPKILWLDDEPYYSQVYVTPILEEMGFIVDYVQVANTALKMLEQTAGDSRIRGYDIIVTDGSRPVDPISTGMAFADSASKISQAVPIIMFTFSYNEKKDGMPKSIIAVTHEAYPFIQQVLDLIDKD